MGTFQILFGEVVEATNLPWCKYGSKCRRLDCRFKHEEATHESAATEATGFDDEETAFREELRKAGIRVGIDCGLRRLADTWIPVCNKCGGEHFNRDCEAHLARRSMKKR